MAAFLETGVQDSLSLRLPTQFLVDPNGTFRMGVTESSEAEATKTNCHGIFRTTLSSQTLQSSQGSTAIFLRQASCCI